MAGQSPTAVQAEPGSESSTAPNAAPRSMLKALTPKLTAIGFILAVVAAECVTVYYLFPTPSQAAATDAGIAASAGKDAPSPEADQHTEKHGEDSKYGKDESNRVEVDLGEFSLTAAQPSANTTLQVTFHLYGTVDAADEEEFVELKRGNEHRFREQVLVTVRGAKISDLTDAGLGLLKREILGKTNAVLGKPILKAVIFSDFAFIEH